MNSAESILYYALKEIGSLYGVPDTFPYKQIAKEFLPKLFYPVPLSVRSIKDTTEEGNIIYHS